MVKEIIGFFLLAISVISVITMFVMLSSIEQSSSIFAPIFMLFIFLATGVSGLILSILGWQDVHHVFRCHRSIR